MHCQKSHLWWFMIRISSWNFLSVFEAMAWARVKSFSWKLSAVRFLPYTNFDGKFGRARETLVKYPQVLRRPFILLAISFISTINSLNRSACMKPRWNGHHLADDIYKSTPWMKLAVFQLILHWLVFPTVQLTINNCLVPNMQQAIIWTNEGLVYCLLTHICVTRT